MVMTDDHEQDQVTSDEWGMPFEDVGIGADEGLGGKEETEDGLLEAMLEEAMDDKDDTDTDDVTDVYTVPTPIVDIGVFGFDVRTGLKQDESRTSVCRVGQFCRESLCLVYWTH